MRQTRIRHQFSERGCYCCHAHVLVVKYWAGRGRVNGSEIERKKKKKRRKMEMDNIRPDSFERRDRWTMSFLKPVEDIIRAVDRIVKDIVSTIGDHRKVIFTRRARIRDQFSLWLRVGGLRGILNSVDAQLFGLIGALGRPN